MTKQSAIYFRKELSSDNEYQIAKKYFKIFNKRSDISKSNVDIIIGRYSVLPYYRELEDDINEFGKQLINTYHQHMFAANMGNWIAQVKELTPKTWNRLEDIPEEGPFVLKGETNSKKFLWSTHMFASNKKEAIEVSCRLMDDGLICDQNIFIREYIPLVTYLKGFKDLPVTKEFRFFVLDQKIMVSGYYWSNYSDDIPGGCPNSNEVPKDFLNEVISRIGDKIRFYAVDIAQAQDGRWLVIDVNDGQMSGLSCCDPEILYQNLSENLNKEKHEQYRGLRNFVGG